jgi:hypothetical protein
MFRPIDTLAYDIDWPIEGGRIIGLRDARVIVTKRPTGMAFPCDIVITRVRSSNLIFALRARGGSVYDSSKLTIYKGNTATTTRASNDYLTVDIVNDNRSFSTSNSTPLRVVPCCVIWLAPTEDVFDGSVLPEPNNGWSKEVDTGANTITYRADEVDPGSPTEDRFKMVNGLARPNLVITADGDGSINNVIGQPGGTSTITINPGLRDLSNNGRVL